MWPQKAKQTRCQKKFSILKSIMGIESEKYANKLEIKKVCKQVKDGAQ